MERLTAARALQKAASELSTACIDYLAPPSNVVPMVQFYNRSVLEQPVSVEFAWLLGKIQ